MNEESMQIRFIVNAFLLGVGATLVMDIWGLFLKRGLGVKTLSYAIVGRWLGHLYKGIIYHNTMAKAPKVKHELAIGWIAHYIIGIAFGFFFLLFVELPWLQSPSLISAISFGVATVILPFFIMQPCFGMGIAASKTPAPTTARVRSLMTHGVFGLGLYLTALIL